MNSSFYNSISGIKSHQFGLDVWADNISNISTVGYRSATPEFSTMYATSLAGSYSDSVTNNYGLGSSSQTTSLNMESGIYQPTDNVFDLSIGGEGWFGIKTLNNQTYYTRAGEFSIDGGGNLVDPNGNYLLGTSANNLTETTLRDDILEKFGTYYKKDTKELGSGFSVEPVNDITLGPINEQGMINLPDILYIPPVATTYVNYKANLNPKVIVDSTNIDLDPLDISSNIDENNLLNITGTVSNTTELQDPKKDDTIILNVTDADGKKLTFKTKLDENLNWSLNNEDLSELNLSEAPTISASLQTVQEIPNVEHFTTEVISDSGIKQVIDMTFTKRVPQNTLATTWDSDIKLLEFYEDYKVELYNPNTTYDENIYKINDEQTQVTKIYDPSLYYVDTVTDKVYSLIDSQTGNAVFSGSGNLISKDIPLLNTGNGTIDINIGTPYSKQDLTSNEPVINGNNITISGDNTGLDANESITINITDVDGKKYETSAKIAEDGSWSTTFETTTLNTTEPLNIEAFNVENSGFDGVISHVDLEKSKVAEKDGYYEGLLNGYGMDSAGNVVAEFSNGKSTAIAKIALYHFQNDQGLEKVSSTIFSTSSNSGEAFFYTDAEGNNIQGSDIYSNKLESSNVSFATALTELIIMQKAFDASAKGITTSDQMIQNAINMKK